MLQEVRWHGSYVTACDRQTAQQDFCACVRVCADGHVVSAPQDGLVQAAALREGFQRFLHQDRHQEGGQVSDGRMRITSHKGTRKGKGHWRWRGGRGRGGIGVE